MKKNEFFRALNLRPVCQRQQLLKRDHSIIKFMQEKELLKNLK